MFRVTSTSAVARSDRSGAAGCARDGGGAPADLVALVERSWDATAAACRAAEDLLDAARERDDRGAAERLVCVLDACVRGQAAMGGALDVLRGGPVDGPADARPWTYGAAPLLADGPRVRG